MAPGRVDGFNAFDDDYEDMTGSYSIFMWKFVSQIRLQSTNRAIIWYNLNRQLKSFALEWPINYNIIIYEP